MKRHGLLVALVAIVWVVAPTVAEPQPIDPHNPPEGLFSNEWAEIYLAGNKVGYAHATMSRDADIIHTVTKMRMDLGRVGQSITIELNQSTKETLAGVPLTFGSNTKMATVSTKTAGTVADGKVTIVSSQFGMDQTQTFDFPKGAVMTWGTYRESILRGFQTGTTYDLSVYAPDMRMDDAVVATTKVGEMEEFEHRGAKRKGRKMSVTMTSPIGSLELVSWVRPDGQPIKSLLPLPGMGNLAIIEADEQAALSDFVAPEIFITTTIKAGRPIDRRRVKRITYRLSRIGSDDSPSDSKQTELPQTGMQQVTRVSEDTVRLVVQRQEHKIAGWQEGVYQKPVPSEYIDANLAINTGDPDLRKLANRAAGGLVEPFALADKLRKFVSEYVTTKNMNIGFATASEVCRQRTGDCSEHAVLLAALGRLNGLPSRVVVGLAYVPLLGNERDVFGYHMWTQFFIDNRWIDVDAALGETRCSPARIAFAVSSLKNAGLVDLSLPLLGRIGATELQIVEVEP